MHISLLIYLLYTFSQNALYCTAFVVRRGIPAITYTQNQKCQYQSSKTTTKITSYQMKTRKSGVEGNEEDFQRYNDDAFGLVFLIGGFASEDVEFSVTFLILSAAAAAATSTTLLKLDSRIPGLVAIASLLSAPLISSLRSTGSIDNIQTPVPLEIAVCCISMVWGLFGHWKKEQKV